MMTNINKIINIDDSFGYANEHYNNLQLVKYINLAYYYYDWQNFNLFILDDCGAEIGFDIQDGNHIVEFDFQAQKFNRQLQFNNVKFEYVLSKFKKFDHIIKDRLDGKDIEHYFEEGLPYD